MASALGSGTENGDVAYQQARRSASLKTTMYERRGREGGRSKERQEYLGREKFKRNEACDIENISRLKPTMTVIDMQIRGSDLKWHGELQSVNALNKA